MMHGDAGVILRDLQAVADERRLREADTQLAERVNAVKSYQQRRFEHTYADLLASSRYAAAARFFLDDLYGPRDFTRRDAEFARVVPSLVRLFPAEIVTTVASITRLHALSESLDTEMARQLPQIGGVTSAQYAAAWQRTGRRPDRAEQIRLTLTVGSALDRYTRSALLRTTLRMMRSPAQAAGLGDLQRFLESGFDAFRDMKGATDFLRIVGDRERDLADSIFNAHDVSALRRILP